MFRRYFLRSLLIFLLGLILIGLSSWLFSIFRSFFLLPIYILLALAVAYFTPVLFKLVFKIKVYQGEYRQKLLEFASKQNIFLKEIYVKKGGVYEGLAIGFWNNKSVVFSDKLLRTYSFDQIEAVFAHELGHHFSFYVSIHACLFAAIIFLAGWLETIFISLLPYPLALVVISFLSLLLALFLSRRGERQADGFAKDNLKNPQAFVSFFQASINDSQKNGIKIPKNPWYKFFYTHPWVYERIAFFEDGA
jgi:Zn-dependent protease with chaperone function